MTDAKTSLTGPELPGLTDLLLEWLPRQRWLRVRVVSCGAWWSMTRIELTDVVRHVIIEVTYQAGSPSSIRCPSPSSVSSTPAAVTRA